MQGNGFTVEPGALRQLADQLVTLSSELDGARVRTQQVDTSGFGSDKLRGAAEHFVAHWTWQGQKISGTAAEVGKRLGQAADQYESVERAQLSAQGQGTAP
ncbi:MAG: Excreted virulence factor EspC, type diderm [Blastococcus sp.]|nr:Excreted virulence factor EspC, type diderm [Blastococcus sp.]